MKTEAISIAELLLDIQAITINTREPFRYSSGILSPIYCDNRLVISYPTVRKLITDAFIKKIEENDLSVDVIAGTATAGIPHAAWIADRLNLPMVYVRGDKKKHGKENQVEGCLKQEQRVLLIEDLISTGSSVAGAAEALRSKGAVVDCCLAIFTYGLKKSNEVFSKAHLKSIVLSDLATLLFAAKKKQQISEEEALSVLEWVNHPSEWRA